MMEKLASNFRTWVEVPDDRREHGHACGCCEIPETHCPPRTAGHVHFKIGRGALAEAQISVRNVGKQARNFAFEPSALAGSNAGTAKLVATPANALLAPGQSVLVRVQLLDSAALSACQDYRAELVIRGAWEQCVKLYVQVSRDPYVECSVDQSDSFGDRKFHSRNVKAGIDWKILRGMAPTASLSVSNTGKEARVFSFMPSALAGPQSGGSCLVVTPDALQLDEGEVGVVQVQLDNTFLLSAGQRYRGEILVRGFYDQRLLVTCTVEPDASAYLEVKQGEAPTRVRAHRWYDHFQCTESCLPQAPQ
jgi:hypothetical protein